MIPSNCPTAPDWLPLAGSTAVAIAMPMPPAICSPAMEGMAKASCSTKPSAKPITASPTSATKVSTASMSSGTRTGIQLSTNTAIAAAKMIRTCTGTARMPNSGAASSAAPTRTIVNSSIHGYASSPAMPRSSRFTGPKFRQCG